tara:strand:- start:1669 stop:1989 length:321 start_codon:yes stop_codon:yes gene_type:complete
MDSILEKFLSELDSKINIQQKKLKDHIKGFRAKGKTAIDIGKVKLEIKKVKYELNKEYKKVGKYVANNYIKKNVVDFTYDEKYNDMLEKIKKINIYISSLEKSINN